MFLYAAQEQEFGVAPASQGWGEAWKRLAGSSSDAQAYIEGMNADELAMREVYRRQNERIHRLTGVQIENPYDFDYREAISEAAMQEQRRMADPSAPLEDPAIVLHRAEAQWNTKVSQIATANPALMGDILADLDEEKNALLRESQQRFDDAAEDPALGTAGRWSAIIGGGLAGAARDPYQWGLAILGGGAGAGRTVAARIGAVVASEAAINAGAELGMQLASQERKREAGLDHGPDDILRNVAIAGTFGALFGGGVQGLSEVARAYRLGRADKAALKRVAEGSPQPGDVQALAAATGRPLTVPEEQAVARGIEEDALDDALLPKKPAPRDVAAMDQALRFAEDPDEALPPELAERLADDGRPRSLTLRDYEELYGLEPEEVSDAPQATLRPATVAEPLDDAALLEAEALAGEIGAPAEVDRFVGLDEGWSLGADRQKPRRAAIRYKGETVVADSHADAMKSIKARFGKDALLDIDADPDSHLGYIFRGPDPLAGQLQSTFDYLPVADGDGNVRLLPPKEALDLAGEDDFLAEILEACKL